MTFWDTGLFYWFCLAEFGLLRPVFSLEESSVFVDSTANVSISFGGTAEFLASVTAVYPNIIPDSLPNHLYLLACILREFPQIYASQSSSIFCTVLLRRCLLPSIFLNPGSLTFLSLTFQNNILTTFETYTCNLEITAEGFHAS